MKNIILSIEVDHNSPIMSIVNTGDKSDTKNIDEENGNEDVDYNLN